MDLTAKLKERIAEASIGSNERVTLNSILGEYTRSKHMTDPVHFVEKWIKENDDQCRRFRRDPKEVSRIKFESDVLRSLLD